MPHDLSPPGPLLLCLWCDPCTCDDAGRSSSLDEALDRLRRFKPDADAVQAARLALHRLDEPLPVWRLDDDAVMRQVAARLADGRLRLCQAPVAPAGGGQGGGAAPMPPAPRPPAPRPPAPRPPAPPAPIPPAPIPPPPIEPPQLGHLIVTVIDDETDKPEPGVPVKISGRESREAPSNGDGKATFNGLQPGGYSITHGSSCLQPASTNASVQAGQTALAELRVRHTHAAISIQQLAFSGHNRVEKDTLGLFPTPEWVEGRAQDAQSPVSYARSSKVSFTATFKVVTEPCRPEQVKVRATGTFGPVSLRWTGSVTVKPGDKTVSTALTSLFELADKVGLFENSDLIWEMNPAERGWSAAGSSRTVIYVTLGNPAGTPNHWTLLDVSCRAAAGATDADQLAAKQFVPFTGRSIKRKRDGTTLTYWNPDTTTVTNTHELLASADGSGQCGSWAELLRDMFRVHGVTSAHKVEILRSKPTRNQVGFLVKNWTFAHPPASSASAFTHVMRGPGRNVSFSQIPGQSNPTPPPAFFNHFIVVFGGNFYDPSYGAGPFANRAGWEAAGVAGLFKDAPPPPDTGFDTALGGGTLLEFWDLETGARLP